MGGSGATRLRRATPADAEALADIVAEGFASYRAFAPAGWEAPGRLELAIGLAGRLLQDGVAKAVALDAAGTPAGHVVMIPAPLSRMPGEDPALGHLEQLFVRRAHWGDGTAAALLGWAVEEAPGLGFERLRLYTPLDHARALRFYEREGWERAGEPLSGEPIGLTLVELRRPVG